MKITPHQHYNTEMPHATKSPPQKHINKNSLSLSLFSKRASENVMLNKIITYDGAGDIPIQKVDPKKILEDSMENIRNTAKDWDCSELDVMSMLGDPRTCQEPVCGVSANNILKLFLDQSDTAIGNTKTPHLGCHMLRNLVESRDIEKSYILKITDPNLEHSYVLDIPAGGNVKNPDIYMYQSDLGDGATKTLILSDWMQKKGMESFKFDSAVSLSEKVRDGTVSALEIAEIFDADNLESNIQLHKLKSGHDIKFSFNDYVEGTLQNNINSLI